MISLVISLVITPIFIRMNFFLENLTMTYPWIHIVIGLSVVACLIIIYCIMRNSKKLNILKQEN